MQLKTLFEGVSFQGALPQSGAVCAELVTQDSRCVCQGSVFVCVKGRSFDGHLYAKQALEQGAVCVVTEQPLGLQNEVCVQNTRKAYAQLCQNFFDKPAEKLRLIAVTGTNGKTTVTSLIHQALEKTGHRAGLIGTIHTVIDQMEVPAKYTTPEAWDMAALLARMVSAGCEFAVMEASSQALDQMRLWGLSFEVGVFTNLTQDHLDYHGDFEAYYQAKKSLFSQTKKAIVNLDDDYGKRLVQELNGQQSLTFSVKEDAADYTAKNIQLSAGGVQFEMVGTNFIRRIRFPMPGDYSVHNALAAAAVLVSVGVGAEETAAALESSRAVRGRCEVLYHKGFTVLCDFAHTGDGIEKVLSGIAPFVEGRLLVLFGCAGERDARKRKHMAYAAAKYADLIVLTSDNPRKEDPQKILDDVSVYLNETKKPYLAIMDRRAAVETALEMMQEHDVLILCGKGHEDYQVIDGVTIYLDEHRIVEDWAEKRESKRC